MIKMGKLLRAAAVFYALDVVIASVAFALDPGKLAHTAATTGVATRLLAAEPMIRISMLTEATYQTIEVFLAIQLYRLFKPVSSGLSQQMMAFALIPIPIMFLNLLPEIAALMFAGRSALFTTFTAPQRDFLVGLLIDLHGEGLSVAACSGAVAAPARRAHHPEWIRSQATRAVQLRRRHRLDSRFGILLDPARAGVDRDRYGMLESCNDP